MQLHTDVSLGEQQWHFVFLAKTHYPIKYIYELIYNVFAATSFSSVYTHILLVLKPSSCSAGNFVCQ